MKKTLPVDKISPEEIKKKLTDEAVILTVTEGGEPLFVILRAGDYYNLLNLIYNLRSLLNRGDYLQMLVEEGVSAEELRRLNEEFDQIDREFAVNPTEAISEALKRSQQHFEAWCVQRGINPGKLTDEAIAEIADQAIQMSKESK